MESKSNSHPRASDFGLNLDHGVLKLQVPEVTWYKHAGLRKLYVMTPILMLCATVNGYDGSLLKGLQTMDTWQDCKLEAQ
jgi:hypothetical protein